MTLEQVLSLAKHLPLEDKRRLIEQINEEIDREYHQNRVRKSRSLLGLCADLGPAPSTEEIDEARSEAWANFPREE